MLQDSDSGARPATPVLDRDLCHGQSGHQHIQHQIKPCVCLVARCRNHCHRLINRDETIEACGQAPDCGRLRFHVCQHIECPQQQMDAVDRWRARLRTACGDCVEVHRIAVAGNGSKPHLVGHGECTAYHGSAHGCRMYAAGPRHADLEIDPAKPEDLLLLTGYRPAATEAVRMPRNRPM